jgi:uncharacterized membrane protein
VSSLADRIRESERRRFLLRAAIRSRVPALASEYAKMIVGTVLGFGIVTLLVRRFTDVDPLWILGGVSLMYSLRAAYYKFRLAADAGFTVPKCGCAGAANDRTEVVLQSTYSKFLGVPNAVLGSLLYAALLVTVAFGWHAAATALAVTGLLGSVYLGHAMVMRIGALCPTCVTIAGLNVLMVLQLLSAAAG